MNRTAENRSCEDHVFVRNSYIQNNPLVFTAFIDLRKCLDFIDRDMMLYKLILNGIDGKMYNTIKRIYQHTMSCVKVNSKHTDWFDCKTGAKQGDNVSQPCFLFSSMTLTLHIKYTEERFLCFPTRMI